MSFEKININETPIRTSKNYNINNIVIEKHEIANKTNEFDNLDIIKESEKIYIEDNTSEIELKYGVSEILTNQIIKNNNINKKIIIDCKTNKEIHLNFNIDEDNLNLIENIEIVANKGCKATIVFKYMCEDNSCSNKGCQKVKQSEKENISGYHNGLIRLKASEESEINIIVVNFINNNTSNFIAIQNEIEKNANVKYNIIDFGGNKSVTNYFSNLNGENANNNLNCIYLGSKNQVFDLNYITELRGEKSNINIEVQGALKDFAKKHFKGTIDFKKGCKKATGNENENCVLLSDTAKSIALPMLLCTEEDIEGNHSTSAGKIEEKELFYIMSRGIDKNEAMKLRVKANFNNILKNVKNDELKNEILREINCKMDI